MAPAEQPDRTAVHRDAVAAADRSGDGPGVADAVEALADVLADEGIYDRAAVLLGGAQALRGEEGGPAARDERTLAVVEEALGEVRLAECLAEGRRLSSADVVSLALRQA